MTLLHIAVGVVFSLTAVTAAQADPWKRELDASLMLTQTSYSDNWAGGEAGSLAWAINSSFLAEKQLDPKFLSKNTVKLAFGQLHNQDRDTRDWDKPVKSTDLIDLESVLNLTLGGFVDPFVSGRVESQFYDNREADMKGYFNPTVFTEALGISKALLTEEKDGAGWSLRLGGGFRQFLDRDALDPVSLERSDLSTNDGGLEFVSDLKYPLSKEKLELTSKLNVFRAFFYSESDKLEGLPNGDYWKTPDVRWDNTLTANVTKYVMVSLYIQFLYDKEVDLGGRLKQTLAMGLTYKLK
ncbi:MAG: DUF3078 domain-containing protein [Candidatus Eisenbacteria bacterium]|nr:DUF3078 domain-containing protein [Candidatus Eisenbacteria bacterium]